MNQKAIINCAVTGAIHVPSLSPYLPITPDQIAEEAIAATKAGAATVHLHARDPETGRPVMDTGLFREFCQKVHNSCDAVICLTTGGAPTMSPEERMTVVRELKPELASVNMGSFNYGMFPMAEKITDYAHDWEKPYLEGSKDLIFKNTFYDQERIFAIMEACGTKPELECYDVGHIYNTAFWADRGVIKPPFWIQLILGVNGAIQASVANLLFMKETADKLFGKDYHFSVLATGRHEFNLGLVGVMLGGSPRVGMEDNLYLEKGVPAKSNRELVLKMKHLVETLSFDTASPADARRILGLKGKTQTDF